MKGLLGCLDTHLASGRRPVRCRTEPRTTRPPENCCLVGGACAGRLVARVQAARMRSPLMAPRPELCPSLHRDPEVTNVTLVVARAERTIALQLHWPLPLSHNADINAIPPLKGPSSSPLVRRFTFRGQMPWRLQPTDSLNSDSRLRKLSFLARLASLQQSASTYCANSGSSCQASSLD